VVALKVPQTTSGATPQNIGASLSATHAVAKISVRFCHDKIRVSRTAYSDFAKVVSIQIRTGKFLLELVVAGVACIKLIGLPE
jgi:hypothetical protein